MSANKEQELQHQLDLAHVRAIELSKQRTDVLASMFELEAKYNAAQERIHQFDQCIRAVAEALNAPACGGVDTDIDDPCGTTAVLVGRAKELADRVKKADDRVRMLTDAVKLAETYLAERVSNSGTVGRTVVLPRLRKALNATPQQTAEQIERVCNWSKDEDGNWETSCGNLHILIEDGMNYCCYCGKPLPKE